MLTIPSWLIPDNWDDGTTLVHTSSLTEIEDVSPNMIKGVFGEEIEFILHWIVKNLIDSKNWRVSKINLPVNREGQVLYIITVPNRNEKPYFFHALKFYLEQIYEA